MHACHPRARWTTRNGDGRPRQVRGGGPGTATRAVLVLAGAGVVAATGLTVASLSGAISGHRADVVVFGDSYYSAPDAAALQRPCARSDRNWSRTAAAETGYTVHDWSCGGATSASLVDLVREAVATGDLDRDTGTVFLSGGGNDFAHQAAVRGESVDDLPGRRATVLANMATAVQVIRDTAPDATLVMSNYLPSTVGPYVCRDAGPLDGVSLPVYDQALDEVEGYISETMGIAAMQAGADFVDLRSAAADNSTCSPVWTRFVAGEETGAPDVLMAWHPTRAGVRFMTDQFVGHFA